MIMIIAIICIFFFILCDIWSKVENYFQKILSSPWKKSTPPFYSLSPLPAPPKNSKKFPHFREQWKFFNSSSPFLCAKLVHIKNKTILSTYHIRYT